jgi:hypothetical protein
MIPAISPSWRLKGGADYNWVKQTIESARQAGIRWVIVGLHRYCLVIGSAHDDTCTAPDVMNLLISEKVDVVLTGEKHGYQATKQLVSLQWQQLPIHCTWQLQLRLCRQCEHELDPGPRDGLRHHWHGRQVPR